MNVESSAGEPVLPLAPAAQRFAAPTVSSHIMSDLGGFTPCDFRTSSMPPELASNTTVSLLAFRRAERSRGSCSSTSKKAFVARSIALVSRLRACVGGERLGEGRSVLWRESQRVVTHRRLASSRLSNDEDVVDRVHEQREILRLLEGRLGCACDESEQHQLAGQAGSVAGRLTWR